MVVITLSSSVIGLYLLALGGTNQVIIELTCRDNNIRMIYVENLLLWKDTDNHWNNKEWWKWDAVELIRADGGSAACGKSILKTDVQEAAQKPPEQTNKVGTRRQEKDTVDKSTVEQCQRVSTDNVEESGVMMKTI